MGSRHTLKGHTLFQEKVTLVNSGNILQKSLDLDSQTKVYTVHGILQARILEWVAFCFSRGSSHPRDWTQVSHIAGGLFTSWATRAVQVTNIGHTSETCICFITLALVPRNVWHSDAKQLLLTVKMGFNWKCFFGKLLLIKTYKF